MDASGGIHVLIQQEILHLSLRSAEDSKIIAKVVTDYCCGLGHHKLSRLTADSIHNNVNVCLQLMQVLSKSIDSKELEIKLAVLFMILGDSPNEDVMELDIEDLEYILESKLSEIHTLQSSPHEQVQAFQIVSSRLELEAFETESAIMKIRAEKAKLDSIASATTFDKSLADGIAAQVKQFYIGQDLSKEVDLDAQLKALANSQVENAQNDFRRRITNRKQPHAASSSTLESGMCYNEKEVKRLIQEIRDKESLLTAPIEPLHASNDNKLAMSLGSDHANAALTAWFRQISLDREAHFDRISGALDKSYAEMLAVYLKDAALLTTAIEERKKSVALKQ